MVSFRILSFFAAQLVGAIDSKVYAPKDGSTDGPIVILWPSVTVPAEYYEPTMLSIQRYSVQSLWGVIADPAANGCVSDLEGALDLAVSKGWSKSAGSAWLAGHEDNETCAEKLLSNDDVAGAILLGALPSADFDFPNSKPTFILSAELHGGAARPGRVATWWRRHVELVKEIGLNRALREKPLVILKKLNSSNFCPGYDVLDDLEAEVDEGRATSYIGSAVASFLDGIYHHEASEMLGELTQTTAILMQPFLDALDMDHIFTDGLDVNGSSPFCEKAQLLLSGLSSEDKERLEVTDQFSPRLAYNFSAHEDPTGTLMHCHPNVSETGNDKLSVKVCSYAGHDGANSSGTERYRSFDGAAAAEVGCKMTSGDFLAMQLGTEVADHNTSCATINTYALQVAQGMLSYEQLRRWHLHGRGICIVADTQTPNNVGPLWIYGTTNYTETESCLEVSGFHLKLPVDADHLPGVEYCKVMSPAFALDYLLTGSMKPAGSRTFLV